MITFYILADARPDFIPLQYASLCRFLKEDFRYVVLNNGATWLRRRRITEMCFACGVDTTYPITRNHHDPCLACAIPLQSAYESLMVHDTFPVIFDSDMFLVAPLSLRTYLSRYDLAAVPQSRGKVDYLWNGILFLKHIPDKSHFSLLPGIVEGESTDVGGQSYYWLKKNKPKVRWIHHTSTISKEHGNLSELPVLIRRSYQDAYHFEIYDHLFLHYSRGSNWDKERKDYHAEKTALLRRFVTGAISGELQLPAA